MELYTGRDNDGTWNNGSYSDNSGLDFECLSNEQSELDILVAR